VNAEDYGNLHYGYTGSAGGFSSDTLLKMAGLVQIVTLHSKLSWFGSNFDQPSDQVQIKLGITAYKHYTTPSGAVVTGLGDLVSAPPAGKSSSSGGGGYGSPGSVYTGFVPANAHSACGMLCR